MYFNGLRETVMPNGWRLAYEKLARHRHHDGRVERIIKCTIVAVVVAGAVVALATPVVPRSRVVPVLSVDLFPYYPVALASPFYGAFDYLMPDFLSCSSPATCASRWWPNLPR
ncbi:hypothetical protein DFAR_3690060 [Desulfarculales bacterium]